MSMKYIRDYYGVPAKRGGIIEYTGGKSPVRGVITGADGAWLESGWKVKIGRGDLTRHGKSAISG